MIFRTFYGRRILVDNISEVQGKTGDPWLGDSATSLQEFRKTSSMPGRSLTHWERTVSNEKKLQYLKGLVAESPTI